MSKVDAKRLLLALRREGVAISFDPSKVVITGTVDLTKIAEHLNECEPTAAVDHESPPGWDHG